MYPKTILILMILSSAYLAVECKWTRNSYDNIVCRKKKSCFDVISPKSKIKTTPSKATCGDGKTTRVRENINGSTWINCKHECPFPLLQYPRILGKMINKASVFNKEFESWSEGCSSKALYSRIYKNKSDYDNIQEYHKYRTKAPTTCFTGHSIQDHKQATHTFWIKPFEHTRRGTLVSFNRDPYPSVVLWNNYLVLHNAVTNKYTFLDNSLKIPANHWTHIGLQMLSVNFPYIEVFINGTYINAMQTKASNTTVHSMNITLAVSSNIYGNYNGFVTYPLEVQQCRDIGYSASVGLLCKSPSFKHLTDCSNHNLSSQSYLQHTFFSDDHEWSLYKCPYDETIISLFTCGYFLPAFSYETRYRGMFPCKRLCEEFYTNCGNYVKNIPSLNSSCAFYPQTNCITRDYLPDVGIFKGMMKGYDIRDKILTSREMKVLGDANTYQLPVVEPMTNCLCDHKHPVLVEPEGMKCISNEYKLNNMESEARYFRFGATRHLDYHYKEYVLDSDVSSNWISTPGLENVSLDISFHDTVQVLGIKLSMASAAPIYTPNGQFPIELSLLNVYDKWTLVSVLTNNSSKCRKYNASHPGDVKCFTYKDIQNQTTYYIDLLNQLEKFYNKTHMDVRLVSLLRATGLKIQFNGFSIDKNRYSTPEYLYHAVADVSVSARYYTGKTTCGCYEDGTNISLSCDETTRQCQCKSRYRPFTGTKCHPYINLLKPSYGPKSGGTEMVIPGGIFGTKKPTINILIGEQKLNNVEILGNNDTVIRIKTGELDTKEYPEALGKPLKIMITLYNGHVIPNDFAFTYKEDPVIQSVEPLNTILQGGIEQTVMGSYLDSVAVPYLRVTLIAHGQEYEGIRTPCRVVSATMMICLSPDLCKIEGLILGNGVPDKKNPDIASEGSNCGKEFGKTITTDITNDDWFKVNSHNIRFHVGLDMDGIKTKIKDNLTVYINPEFDRFDPEIIELTSSERDKYLSVTGRRLKLGCTIKDYKVLVGGENCDVSDLTSNQFMFKPPVDAPESSQNKLIDGAHSVICKVGNIKVKLGYVKYKTAAFFEKPVFVGVMCLISLLVVVIGVVVLLCILHRCKIINLKFGQRKHEHQEDLVQHNNDNVYTGLVKHNTLLERLQEYDIGLYLSISNSQLECAKMSLGKQIGQGNFGSVNEGHYLLDNENTHVAVKSMKTETDDIEKVAEFLKEGTIMAEFKHENVLSMLGVVIQHDIPYIVLPFMEHRDLKAYLSNPMLVFTCEQLLNYAIQIAWGMSYLSDCHFVHRDLAARNCMVNTEQVVKIADFGLSRDIYEKDYYTAKTKSRPMPVKWMAIESLDNSKFTSMSDVWSFGVTMWEIIMRGEVPYKNIPNFDLNRYVLCGNRLKQPLFCPDSIYALMHECWNRKPHKRPTFNEIVTKLEEFLAENAHKQAQDERYVDHSIAQEGIYETIPDVDEEILKTYGDQYEDGYLAPVDCRHNESLVPVETCKNQLEPIHTSHFDPVSQNNNVKKGSVSMHVNSVYGLRDKLYQNQPEENGGMGNHTYDPKSNYQGDQ